MLRVFNGKGHPRADTAPHHVPASGSTRHGPHRHHGAVPGSIGRLAIRRHIRGQRFPLPAPVRDPGQERIGHPRYGAAVCADMGVPRVFRTDNGVEYTISAFVKYCNSLHIRRELTALYTP